MLKSILHDWRRYAPLTFSYWIVHLPLGITMKDAFHMQRVILHLPSLCRWNTAHLYTPRLPVFYSCSAIPLPPLSCRSTSGYLFLCMPCSPALRKFTLPSLIDRHRHHSRSEDRNQPAALCPSLTWFCVGGRIEVALISSYGHCIDG